MTTFVLVHGAWHGSWCWKRVRRSLQGLGHEVFTPTLTGVADRSHVASREVNLDTHILDVANLIRFEELSEVVLCGHSYAGAVITGVADHIPERIRSLVYLDAFIPEDGEDLMRYVPHHLVDDWQVHPIPAERFEVNLADREWVDRQCTPQPLGCWEQSLRLTRERLPAERSRYICALGLTGESGRFLAHYERAKALGWHTSTIACGHDVMLDEPEELVRLLLEGP